MGAPARIRIIGLGNTCGGDDAVGVLAARRLGGLVAGRAEVVEAEMAGLELLELMEGADMVILIDAARTGQPAGTIHRLDASTTPVAAPLFAHSTHALNAVEALELARALGRLPDRVLVYGIEVEELSAGRSLSPTVGAALEQVVRRVLAGIEVKRDA